LQAMRSVNAFRDPEESKSSRFRRWDPDPFL
jgi:hypothetical protein